MRLKLLPLPAHTEGREGGWGLCVRTTGQVLRVGAILENVAKMFSNFLVPRRGVTLHPRRKWQRESEKDLWRGWGCIMQMKRTGHEAFNGSRLFCIRTQNDRNQ